jgi:pyruvate,water dikinase
VNALDRLPDPDATPSAPEAEAPQVEGFWTRERDRYPRPVSPLYASAVLPLLNQASARAYAEFGMPCDGIEFREIAGHVYSGEQPMDWKPGKGLLQPLAVRLNGELRRRAKAAAVARQEDKAYMVHRRWLLEDREKLADDAEELEQLDFTSMTDAELLDSWQRVSELAQRGADAHYGLETGYAFLMADLEAIVEDELALRDVNLPEAFSGLATAYREPAQALAEMAAQARASRDLRLAVIEQRPVPEIVAIDPGFRAALEDFLTRYGRRALKRELSEPTLEERPELIFRLLRNQVLLPPELLTDGEAEDRRQEVLVRILHAANEHSPEMKERVRAALERAETAHALRAENEALTAPLALMRYAALEFGRRLAGRDATYTDEDVFYLTQEEMTDHVSGGARLHLLVEQRRQSWAAACVSDSFLTLGEQPESHRDLLPDELKRNRDVLDAFLLASEARAATAENSGWNRRDDIKGQAASPGVVEGIACVVCGGCDFDVAEPGEVLVCREVPPSWALALGGITAIVSDGGGVLSDTALLAREFGIPAVTGTGNATTLLRDGDPVRVDGNRGFVYLLAAWQAPAIPTH